ncbi:GNAT family N-acetyltransferase [Alphaproteobacteria bacterium GH1-50]|uniref:GNAT family N-acetyltransferase n=1 Tax=Kangsaoukella pontilimi TaxID=2691042 RepID=A0A7C9MIB5_9RHOB|nr:GNAT family N-acetyltransferase [Kangsaoukella pontilimi]MXQ09636.1 GNAT family N-acetyltransferase [Kangsaoukella pontilimi]
MTADELARIHTAAMTVPPPWSAVTFRGFLSFPGAILAFEAGGFALGRVIADEAELLTIAVHPEARRRGIARRCLAAFELEAPAKGASRAFLEVAASNAPARRLYEGFGYEEVGRRRGYYDRPDDDADDAILMAKDLPIA